MSSTEKQEFELTAHCLCKAHTFTCHVSRASLPLKATLCHCNSCRHLTGAMYSSSVPWPGPGDNITESSLAKYEVSKRLTLFFCGECSSPMFCRYFIGQEQTASYHVPTGVLSNNDVPGMVETQGHLFVGDTQDGGAAVWLQPPENSDDRETQIPCWESWPKLSIVDPRAMKANVASPLEEIPVHCHCKGVNLVLRSNAAINDFSQMARDELPWFVDPENNKHLASFDSCDSCRISTGADVLNWTFTLLRHLDYAEPVAQGQASFPNNTHDLKECVSASDRDPRLGTLRYYASSPDVQRYFCSRCAATIFYAVDVRPEMVDLAVGLLDAPEGTRAESVLSWGLGMMVWKDDTKGGWREPVVDAIKRNAGSWRIETGAPKTWAVIAREAKDSAV